jgi:hypothetical protein
VSERGIEAAMTTTSTQTTTLKSLAWVCGEMPTPVSVTSTRSPLFAAEMATVILPPSGVNLIALDSRFTSTLRQRQGHEMPH